MTETLTTCLNYLVQDHTAGEFSAFVYEEWLDVMRARGHHVVGFGDEIIMEMV